MPDTKPERVYTFAEVVAMLPTSDQSHTLAERARVRGERPTDVWLCGCVVLYWAGKRPNVTYAWAEAALPTLAWAAYGWWCADSTRPADAVAARRFWLAVASGARPRVEG